MTLSEPKQRLGHKCVACQGAPGPAPGGEGALAGASGDTVLHSSCSGLRPSRLIELLPSFLAPVWLQVVPTCHCRQ